MEIDKKELKEILTEQRKEYERHIGAIAEDFSSQLQGVADSVSGANQRLDTVMEMVAKNSEDIETIKSDISTIKFDLKNKVDLDEFKSLEKRVLFLERKTSHA